MVCPKAEFVCPNEGVVDWNNGDDWVLPKLKLGPNAEAVFWADEEPKIDVDDPKPEALADPKRVGDVLCPKAEVDPNKEGEVEDVEPKGLDVFELGKAEVLKAGVVGTPKFGVLNVDGLGAKGLEDVEDVNGFADDWPKGEVDDDAKAELPKLIPPVDWPAGAGPPVMWGSDYQHLKDQQMSRV